MKKNKFFLLLFSIFSYCVISQEVSIPCKFILNSTSKTIAIDDISFKNNQTDITVRFNVTVKLFEPGSKNAYYIEDTEKGVVYKLISISATDKKGIPANTPVHLYFDKLPEDVRLINLRAKPKNEDFYINNIRLVRKEIEKHVNVTNPGALSMLLSDYDLNSITKLILSGTIDARDFKTIRERMPELTDLDLSEVVIAQYKGSEGTFSNENILYQANTTPERAFFNKETEKGMISLLSVKLPNSIYHIGRSTFANCMNLKSVYIPYKVRSIGPTAFANCIGLSEVSLPATIGTLSENVFDGCINLHSFSTDVTDDGFIIYAGYKNFIPNVNLANCTLYVPIGEKARYAGASVWRDFGNIVEKEYYKTSGSSYFITSPAPGYLSKILSPNSLKTLTELTISGVINALDFVVIRDEMPFLRKLDLRNVRIMEYKGSNGTYADKNINYQENLLPHCSFFNLQTKKAKNVLESILLPSNVKIIGNQCFKECVNLTQLYIPESVKEIDNYAFVGCGAKISVAEKNSNYSSKDGVLFDKKMKTLIHCPVSQKGEYVIPQTVINLISYSFYNCNSITHIIFPATLSEIPESAFYGCSSLLALDFPSSVKSIGNSAFENCIRLKSVNYQSEGVKISENAFNGCITLDSIKLAIQEQNEKQEQLNKQINDSLNYARYSRNVSCRNDFFSSLSGLMHLYYNGHIFAMIDNRRDSWDLIYQETRSMCQDPSNPSVQYLILHSGNVVKRMYEGGDWIKIMNGLPDNNLSYHIQINPYNNSELFLLNISGVYRSTDAGFTWVMYKQSTIPTQLIFDQPNNYYLLDADGIFFTDNGGDNWKKISDNLPKILLGGTGRTAEYKPIIPDMISRFTSGIHSDLIAGSLSGTFLSRDNGNTWEKINDDHLVTAFFSDSALFLGGEALNITKGDNVPVIYQINNNSDEWKKINPIIKDAKKVRGIYQDNTNPGIILKVDDKLGYLDTDSKVIGLNYGLVPHSNILSLVSCNQGEKTVYYALIKNENSIDIERYGVWKSDDNYKTWSKSLIYKEPDNTYGKIKLAVSPFNPFEIWLFDCGFDLITYNGGIYWEKLSDYIPIEHTIQDFEFDPQDKNILFFVTSYYNNGDNKLVRYDKTTKGSTVIKKIESHLHDIILSETNNKKIFISNGDISLDGGWTWQSVYEAINNVASKYGFFLNSSGTISPVSYKDKTIEIQISEKQMYRPRHYGRLVSNDDGLNWTLTSEWSDSPNEND